MAFASGGGYFSHDMPHFEFGHSLHDMRVSYVLFRDSLDFSCQYGVQGVGDREAVCQYIIAIKKRYPRLVLIGLSVGSMQALMYGQLVAYHGVIVDEIIVLSPYTSLGDNPEAAFGHGWRERCPFSTDVPLLTDIKPLFPNGPIPKVRAFLSDGEGTEEDRHHAERIGITDITLVPGSSHAGLGKKLRDNGLLRELILGTS